MQHTPEGRVAASVARLLAPSPARYTLAELELLADMLFAVAALATGHGGIAAASACALLGGVLVNTRVLRMALRDAAVDVDAVASAPRRYAPVLAMAVFSPVFLDLLPLAESPRARSEGFASRPVMLAALGAATLHGLVQLCAVQLPYALSRLALGQGVDVITFASVAASCAALAQRAAEFAPAVAAPSGHAGYHARAKEAILPLAAHGGPARSEAQTTSSSSARTAFTPSRPGPRAAANTPPSPTSSYARPRARARAPERARQPRGEQADASGALQRVWSTSSSPSRDHAAPPPPRAPLRAPPTGRAATPHLSLIHI